MKDKIRVWDPLVRLFHWSLVLSFVLAYASGEEEKFVHVNAGYMVLGLVAFRVLWGFIGGKHARFSDFITPPSVALRYGKDLLAGRMKHYHGHNPLGGWMVIMLLASLSATGYSGLALYGTEGHGPLAQFQAEKIKPDRDSPIVMLTSHDDGDNDRRRGRPADDNHGGSAAKEEFWEEIHEFFANCTLLLVILHIGGVIFSSAREGRNLVKAMLTGTKSQ